MRSEPGPQGHQLLQNSVADGLVGIIADGSSPIGFAPGLPKTRSGKIMRRILRKIAEDDFSNLGDTSTLADPAVVTDLVENRQTRRLA